jgi:hypothetical protein
MHLKLKWWQDNYVIGKMNYLGGLNNANYNNTAWTHLSEAVSAHAPASLWVLLGCLWNEDIVFIVV